MFLQESQRHLQGGAGKVQGSLREALERAEASNITGWLHMVVGAKASNTRQGGHMVVGAEASNILQSGYTWRLVVAHLHRVGHI